MSIQPGLPGFWFFERKMSFGDGLDVGFGPIAGICMNKARTAEISCDRSE
jgi:hypothetical protein